MRPSLSVEDEISPWRQRGGMTAPAACGLSPYVSDSVGGPVGAVLRVWSVCSQRGARADASISGRECHTNDRSADESALRVLAPPLGRPSEGGQSALVLRWSQFDEVVGELGFAVPPVLSMLAGV